MIVKYLEQKNKRVYVFKDDIESETNAKRFAAGMNLDFYPKVTFDGNNFTRDVFNDYLVRVYKIKSNIVISLSEESMSNIDLKSVDLEFDDNKTEPIESIDKNTTGSIKDAKVVFIGGRGLKSRANYERLKAVAEKFGAKCGCTRPVAMNGWESYDNFIGISGNILSADLIVTFGVSGAGPLIKGIEKSRRIVAINNDRNALIFKNADYGIVEDCMKVISELEKQ